MGCTFEYDKATKSSLIRLLSRSSNILPARRGRHALQRGRVEIEHQCTLLYSRGVALPIQLHKKRPRQRDLLSSRVATLPAVLPQHTAVLDGLLRNGCTSMRFVRSLFARVSIVPSPRASLGTNLCSATSRRNFLAVCRCSYCTCRMHDVIHMLNIRPGAFTTLAHIPDTTSSLQRTGALWIAVRNIPTRALFKLRSGTVRNAALVKFNVRNVIVWNPIRINPTLLNSIFLH